MSIMYEVNNAKKEALPWRQGKISCAAALLTWPESSEMHLAPEGCSVDRKVFIGRSPACQQIARRQAGSVYTMGPIQLTGKDKTTLVNSIKAYGLVELEIHLFLTSALNGVISFPPRPFYPQENNTRYPSNRMLGGPQSQFGRFGTQENLKFLPGNKSGSSSP
jgi:hypothetical protein